MSVSFASIGAAGGLSNQGQLAIPAGSVGDGLLGIVAWGNAAGVGPSTPTGWTKIGEFLGGPAVAIGEDLGKRGLTIFWRIANGTETTMDYLGDNTGADSFKTTRGYVLRFTSGLGFWVDPVAVFANDAVAGSNYSATAGSDPGGVTGDHAVIACAVIPGATAATIGATWPGTTGTFTSRGTGQTTTGGNIRMNVSSKDNTGTSSGAPTITYSGDVVGASVLVRLRDTATAPALPPVPNAGADIAAQEPWAPFALDGSASSDPNVGDTLTALWTVTTGNAEEVTIANPNALVTTATVSPHTVENKTFVFTLKVTDPGGLNASDTKSVTVMRAAESQPVDGIDVPLHITTT